VNIIIKAIAWLLKPAYLIHDKCMHGVAADGALLYIEDMAKLRELIVNVSVNLSKEHRLELNNQVMETMNARLDAETDDLRDWMGNTIDNRLIAFELSLKKAPAKRKAKS